jgi:uncharacterized protein
MLLLKRLLKLIVLLCVISAIICWYAYRIEPSRLVVRKLSVGSADASAEVVKLVQFTDVHLGESFSLEMLTRLVDKINEQKPDIVVFTGDLMDKAYQYGHRDEAVQILSTITARCGKYAVWGNHDYGGGATRFYQSMIEKSGFTLLRNQSALIKVSQKHSIMIDGLDEAFFGEPDAKRFIHNSDAFDYRLLLLHEPDLAGEIHDYHADMILAGHSHGGQICLPLFGAILTPPLAKHYYEGMYNLTQGKLYVDSGVGTTHFSARLFNPPQITLFEVRLK